MRLKPIRELFSLIKKGEFLKIKTKLLIKFGSRQVLFTEFYKSNIWGSGESISGPGTELKYTKNIISKLPVLLKEFKITTINDAPCGDFHFMNHINLSDVCYMGFDIVKQLIEVNNKEYSSSGIQFIHFDVLNQILPKCDLILSRDMLIHFSFDDSKRAIDNFKKSGSTYLLTNTYPIVELNLDIKTGSWRPINLQIEPYNFPKPISIIEEYYGESHGLKLLALYKIN